MKYAQNRISLIQHQIKSIKSVISHHYAKRHVYGSEPAREWIRELRRVDAATGYSECIKYLKKQAV